MLIPSFVRLRYFFYPIGNTPAINLLRDGTTSPAGESKILCLGSGDARSILFTLWMEPCRDHRLIHFTACDSEPAVLARNIFLFSYLMSDQCKNDGIDKSTKMLWDMYYHMFVTNDVLSAMTEHLNLLLQASESLQIWAASAYGHALTFLSTSTLVEMRSYWQLHLDAARNRNQDTRIRKEIAKIQRAHISEDCRSLSGSRSGGIHAIDKIDLLGSTYSAYWKTGVVAGNKEDVSTLQHEKGGHANPLLLVSSAPLGVFAVHYGTDPVSGYNIAAALDKVTIDSSAPEGLAKSVKTQFHEWCVAFIQHASARTVQISFHCGDALSLCYTLQRRADIFPNVPEHLFSYARPWSVIPIDIDGDLGSDSPHNFHVIDTSNISDHVGVLNLLPAAVPLLSPDANAVLYTETLLLKDLNASKYCDELLLTDTKAICLFINLAPSGCLLGTSTEHFGTEAMLESLASQGSGQKRMRLAWKHPYGGDLVSSSTTPSSSLGRLIVDPQSLASFFFKWYLNMFAPFEDISQKFRNMLTPTRDTLSSKINYNSRTTLVALIGLVRRRVDTDWSKCLLAMLGMIETDRTLLVGTNSLQELYITLQMSGLVRIPALESPPQTNASIHAAAFGGLARTSLKRYPNMPYIICIVLVVPRTKLSTFTSMDLDQLGTPGLQLSVSDRGTFDNSFFALHTCFGKFVPGNTMNTGTIEEDPAGWKGKSDLVVACMVPSFPFLLGREGETRVSLGVVTTIAATMHLTSSLGMLLCVYETSVNDHKNIHLLPALPNVLRSPTVAPQQVLHSTQTVAATQVVMTDGLPDKLGLRATFDKDSEREDLANHQAVKVTQISPCSLVIKFGKHSRELAFPFPVDAQRSHTKVSRKSFWVEVSVAVTSASQPGGYVLSPFPLAPDRGQLVPWALGKVNLSRCPLIAPDVLLPTLESFIGMGASQKEKAPESETSQASRHERAIFEMKRSIAGLFVRTHKKLGARTHTHNAFRMNVQAPVNDCDFVIFTHGIFHDQSVGSICLGAYVLPLTLQNLDSLVAGLGGLLNNFKHIGINISEDEAVLWKQALPAFVERSRFTWEHKSTCEYQRDGTFKCPRSIVHGETPICSCGEGQDLDCFPPEYAFSARHVTRVAIPILSALPYVEPMVFANAFAAARAAAGVSTASTSRVAEVGGGGPSSSACGHCKARGTDLRSCAGCGEVWYCNRGCQRAAWKAHKAACKKVSAK